MQWPTACKNSGKVFSLEFSFLHKVFSLCWRVTVCLRFRSFVGSPILILSSSVIIANWSFCIHEITCHNPGFLWPTSL